MSHVSSGRIAYCAVETGTETEMSEKMAHIVALLSMPLSRHQRLEGNWRPCPGSLKSLFLFSGPAEEGRERGLRNYDELSDWSIRSLPILPDRHMMVWSLLRRAASMWRLGDDIRRIYMPCDDLPASLHSITNYAPDPTCQPQRRTSNSGTFTRIQQLVVLS